MQRRGNVTPEEMRDLRDCVAALAMTGHDGARRWPRRALTDWRGDWGAVLKYWPSGGCQVGFATIAESAFAGVGRYTSGYCSSPLHPRRAIPVVGSARHPTPFDVDRSGD